MMGKDDTISLEHIDHSVVKSNGKGRTKQVKNEYTQQIESLWCWALMYLRLTMNLSWEEENKDQLDIVVNSINNDENDGREQQHGQCSILAVWRNVVATAGLLAK